MAEKIFQHCKYLSEIWQSDTFMVKNQKKWLNIIKCMVLTIIFSGDFEKWLW